MDDHPGLGVYFQSDMVSYSLDRDISREPGIHLVIRMKTQCYLVGLLRMLQVLIFKNMLIPDFLIN